MANQQRLADNLNRYEANRHGVPRRGSALLQGIAICGRCGHRMGLHYSGPHGSYPVYVCRADQHQHGGPRCQEDGTYSVQGAAAALSISPQTVFKWLQKGRLSGHQLARGLPWQITLSNPQIAESRAQVRRTNRSKKEAS